MKIIEMKFRPVAYMLSVFIFTLLVLNFISLRVLSTSINSAEDRVNLVQNKLEFVSEKINSEKSRMEFASKVLEIEQILSKFRSSSGISNMDLAYLIVSESSKYAVDPYVVLALIKTESSFNRYSVSSKGAMGLMQLLPGTARYISDKSEDLSIGRTDELFDPVTNIKLGIGYYAYLIDKYNSQKYAVIAYNMGPGNVRKRLKEGSPLPLTYYKKVMKNYRLIVSLGNKA